MSAINIDDEENMDWLHKPGATIFVISKNGEEIGKCNIKTEEIDTEDSELEENFYLLIDEGAHGFGPITEYDASDFAEAMRAEGYDAREG